MKKAVTLVEMGLRDGLQNESIELSLSQRVSLADQLLASGVRRLELGAFVRPDKVPQMRSTQKLIEKMYQKYSPQKLSGCSALVPNLHGLSEALETPLQEVAVFTAASESFCQRNIDCSIAESLQRFKPVMSSARLNKIRVRGYLSTGFGCPFEGDVKISRVISLVEKLLDMGCFEVSLGDTIGVASPWQVEKLLVQLLKKVPAGRLAGHFHDTRGTALANIEKAYDLGLRTFDSSIGGLGGCPYAPSATGNVATEDVVYFFEKSKISTGLNLAALQKTSRWLSRAMKKEMPSKMSRLPIVNRI